MKKVLVVDDSALMRKLLGTVLTEAGYEVHSARNGAEGVQQLLELQPHVVTLDINMPEMDGLTALSLMMAARPTPVVMVSSLTEQGALATLEALALGAVDFVAKPGGTISMSIESVRDELLSKVAAASTACLSRPAQRIAASAPAAPCAYRERPRLAPMSGAGLVLIGVSTGGPRTLEEILPALPSGFAWPVLVAQHMPPNFTDAFARRLNSLCALEVVEVDKPMPLKAGHVYVARAGTDMAVARRPGNIVALPRPEAPGIPWHPSVEVLVETAMQHFEPRQLIGVMLTGMGHDGAQAMARLKKAGGRTIAESAATAVVFGMPNELIQQDGASIVLPCHDIAARLRSWLA